MKIFLNEKMYSSKNLCYTITEDVWKQHKENINLDVERTCFQICHISSMSHAITRGSAFSLHVTFPSEILVYQRDIEVEESRC